MIKFSKRQLNTLIDALGNLFFAITRLDMEGTVEALNNYHECEQYANGVFDALSVRVTPNMTGYKERYYIYPSEVCNAALDDNGNRIAVLIIDSFERRIIYDIFKEEDAYSKKYSKQLEDGFRKYYKEVYNEDV